MAKPEHLHCIKMIPNNLLYHLLVFLCVDGSLKRRLVLNQVKRPIFDLLKSSMGFFRLQTSYSNLPKQVGILNPSIQIVFQNIENSSIREHVKIGLKTANFSRISESWLHLWTQRLQKCFCRLILLKENFKSSKNIFGQSIVKKTEISMKFYLNFYILMNT